MGATEQIFVDNPMLSNTANSIRINVHVLFDPVSALLAQLVTGSTDPLIGWLQMCSSHVDVSLCISQLNFCTVYNT